MTLNLSIPGQQDLKPRITVFGVGGAGGNAVNNMIEKQLDGVEFVVANTDAQALAQSAAESRVQLGVKVTEGLGAGARASVGAAAAEESIEQIIDHLAGAHMCFITAGMGGGTGTGAAPIIAQAARELGVLTVGVVTKPFQFEGAKRMRQAEDGVDSLQKVVDTLIIIPNQNLFRLANEKTTFTEAFSMADDVLYQGVKGVTDLMVRPGLINLDFADVRAVMDEMGKAMMGTGESNSEDRAKEAAEKAIANPLLDEISLKGAKGVLINITGGHDLTLFELDEAANCIREQVDPDANIIVGSTLDTAMEGAMRVSVVATGIDASAELLNTPVPRRPLRAPLATETATSEPAQQQPAAHAPAPERPAVAPAAREVIAEAAPEPAPAPVAAEEPGLFDKVAEAPASDVFDPMTAGRDEAVRPSRPEPVPHPAAVADDSHSGISPAVMERLHRAVNKVPPGYEQQQPAARAGLAEAADAAQHGDRHQRFGINSLINRMTGHAADTPAERAQPPMHGGDATAPDQGRGDAEQDRIEIPAFLRRQAN